MAREVATVLRLKVGSLGRKQVNKYLKVGKIKGFGLGKNKHKNLEEIDTEGLEDDSDERQGQREVCVCARVFVGTVEAGRKH